MHPPSLRGALQRAIRFIKQYFLETLLDVAVPVGREVVAFLINKNMFEHRGVQTICPVDFILVAIVVPVSRGT